MLESLTTATEDDMSRFMKAAVELHNAIAELCNSIPTEAKVTEPETKEGHMAFVVQHLDRCGEFEKKEFTADAAKFYIANTENVTMFQYDDVKKDYIVVGRNSFGVIEYPNDIIEEV